MLAPPRIAAAECLFTLVLSVVLAVSLSATLGHYGHRRNEGAGDKANRLCGNGGGKIGLNGGKNGLNGGLYGLNQKEEDSGLVGGGAALAERLVRSGVCDMDVFVAGKDLEQQQQQQLYGEKDPNWQFSRLLLVVVDSLPVDEAIGTVENVLGQHALAWRIDCPGIRYSHAVYDAYWRGQLATNAKGEKTEGDNLFAALSPARSGNAALKMLFAGTAWPTVALFPQELKDAAFAERREISEHRRAPQLFNFLLRTEPGRSSTHSRAESLPEASAQPGTMLGSIFADANAQNLSMFFYTGALDKNMHEYTPRIREAPRIRGFIKKLERDFYAFKQYTDDHPDVLLVLLADHGYDEIGPRGTALHGYAHNGNEPAMVLYSPRFVTDQLQPRFEGSAGAGGVTQADLEAEVARAPEPPDVSAHLTPSPHLLKWIRMVDVAPTISKYLRGVDIPRNVIGLPQNWYGSHPLSSVVRAKALLQSSVQLRVVAAERGSSSFSQEAVASLQARGIELMEKCRGSGETACLTQASDQFAALADELHVALGAVQRDFLRHAQPPIVFSIIRIGLAVVLIIAGYGHFALGMRKRELAQLVPVSLPRVLARRAGADECGRVSSALLCALVVTPWLVFGIFFVFYAFDDLWLTGNFQRWNAVVLFMVLGIVLRARGGAAGLSGPPRWFWLWFGVEVLLWLIVRPFLQRQSIKLYLDALDVQLSRDAEWGARAVTSSLVTALFMLAFRPRLSESSRAYRRAALAAVSCWFLYSLTDQMMSLFFVGGGVHFAYALLLLLVIGLVLAGNCSNAVFPLALLSVVTWQFEPHGQILMILGFTLLERLSFAVTRTFSTTLSTSRDLPTGSNRGGRDPDNSLARLFGLTSRQVRAVALMAITVLIFSDAFLFSKDIVGASTDLFNVPVRAASVGVSGTTKQPLLNGFNMVWNRCGMYVAVAAALWSLTAAVEGRVPDSRRDAAFVFLVALSSWLTGTYEILLGNYTAAHNLQDTFGITVIVCFMGIAIAALHGLRYVREVRPWRLR